MCVCVPAGADADGRAGAAAARGRQVRAAAHPRAEPAGAAVAARQMVRGHRAAVVSVASRALRCEWRFMKRANWRAA